MTETERELDLKLGEALAEIRRLNELAQKANQVGDMPPAQAEQPAQQEPTVSKGTYNRLRDDYNDLLKKSEQDAKDAKEWRAHVNHCQLLGVDLDYQTTTPQPAQQPDTGRSDQQLAEQIMSDCGCSTNNQRLLERIAERLAKHRPPQRKPLSEIDIMAIAHSCRNNDQIGYVLEIARGIEAAHGINEYKSEAAAELRRLHSENKKLKEVLDAARVAMNESTEANDEECSIKTPSHLPAALSLCLDEYDKANAFKEPQ